MIPRAAPFDDECHPPAVAPVVGGGDRRQHLDVVHAGEACELLGDDRRLRLPLGGRRDVLPLAAAAGGEERAAGKDARRTRAQDRVDLGLQVAAMVRHDARHHPIARRGVGEEDDLPLVMRDRVEAEGKPLDVEDEGLSQPRARPAGGGSPRP